MEKELVKIQFKSVLMGESRVQILALILLNFTAMSSDCNFLHAPLLDYYHISSLPVLRCLIPHHYYLLALLFLL